MDLKTLADRALARCAREHQGATDPTRNHDAEVSLRGELGLDAAPEL